MKAVSDCKLNLLVQKLKAYIAGKYALKTALADYAPKGDAVTRKDTDKDRSLNTQDYQANKDAKIFVVNVGITGDVDAACMVCIDFWQIPKSNDENNALKILLPLKDEDNEQVVLKAYRTDKGVPIFHTEGQVYIRGVSSYM